ncbi:MAG: hypothetical protein OXH80_08255, partial [Nitrospira sp.]|nr:hypothetical protein [Nitrospira sp.]
DQVTAGTSRIPEENSPSGNGASGRKQATPLPGQQQQKNRAHDAHDSHGPAFLGKQARGRMRRVKGKLKSRTLVSSLFPLLA